MKWTGNKETVVVVTCKRWEKTETEQRQEEEETSWTLYFILKQRNDHHTRVRPLFHAYYQSTAISRLDWGVPVLDSGGSHPLLFCAWSILRWAIKTAKKRIAHFSPGDNYWNLWDGLNDCCHERISKSCKGKGKPILFLSLKLRPCIFKRKKIWDCYRPVIVFNWSSLNNHKIARADR